MNFQRGMLRIWIVVSILWVIGVAVFFFNPVKAAFEVQDFSSVGILQVPVPCDKVRGQEGKDYENGPWNNYRAKATCWYDVRKFRVLFPEYKDLSEKELSDKLYPAAGVELTPSPNPWPLLGKALLIAIVGPVLLLVTGLVMGWIYLGFRPT
jgi:hypothetical protein